MPEVASVVSVVAGVPVPAVVPPVAVVLPGVAAALAPAAAVAAFCCPEVLPKDQVKESGLRSGLRVVCLPGCPVARAAPAGVPMPPAGEVN